MTTKTSKLRVEKLRAARKVAGLERFEVKAYPEDKAAIKAFVATLTAEHDRRKS